MTAYLSLFSGIGGLEHDAIEPALFCEKDTFCREVLKIRHPEIPAHDDVATLTPPRVDIVAGGWPCQDLSSAGKQVGLRGSRSGLFFEMLRVAKEAEAHTLVGENVPNLLTINRGSDFKAVLDALVAAGFRYVSWRVLNARAFGLPQERRRLFIVASTQKERAWALHAGIPAIRRPEHASEAFGFYWTAGKRSLCFSHGYVPALKIGAADERGRAPVAVLARGRVRKLTTAEFLRVQGFRDLEDAEFPSSSLLRMAGNAVPLPMGRFVMRHVVEATEPEGIKEGFGVIEDSGMYDDGIVWIVRHEDPPLVSNLDEFLDDIDSELSSQACAGLLVRSVRSGHRMPVELFDTLLKKAADRTERLHPSRANSFEALKDLEYELASYREALPALTGYTKQNTSLSPGN